MPWSQPQLREGHVLGKSLARKPPQEDERELKGTRRKKAPTRRGEEHRRLRKKVEAPYPVEGWEEGPRRRANNCQRMRDLTGRNIRALVDGERVTVVGGEGEKSRIVPLGNVSRRREKIPINIVLVAWKGGENKNLGTGERRRCRGGGRVSARGAGEGKNARGVGRSPRGSIIFFLSQC